MSYSREHKARTRQRILESARRRLKTEGLDRVSVDSLMAEAGLTRGGFYTHFASKDALLAAALDDPLLAGYLSKHDQDKEPNHWVRLVLEEYLGTLHRDHPETGCPLSAHVGAAKTAAPEVRSAFTAQVKQAAEALAQRLPGAPSEQTQEALGILALIIGGVGLARAVDDEALSDQILSACRDAISDL